MDNLNTMILKIKLTKDLTSIMIKGGSKKRKLENYAEGIKKQKRVFRETNSLAQPKRY